MALKAAAADFRGELVARERERTLLGSFRREAAGGHGRIVLISGEAGVGKSRILAHFEATLSSGGRTISAFARCVEFVQTPLGPLRELLQGLEHCSSVPRDARTRALIERLTFEGADDANASRPSGLLFESIDAAFARYAAAGSLVLLVEDLQWADRSTLGFLTYLADRIAKRRMLVVATYRSHEVDANRSSLADFAPLLVKQLVTDVSLASLDEDATRELVELGLPHRDALDAATIFDIVRRSRGNPFFAEELTKAALERGSAGASRRLPRSVRGAVLARAATLSDDDRHTLSLAAVLGERFSVDRLLKLAEGRRDDVLRALERARALHLVYDQVDAPDQMIFRHALTQEVLYGELLGERVRPLHRAIALELEENPDPAALCVQLAHHWLRAGDRRRAAVYAETAGDQAFAIGATADAIAFFEEALGDAPSDRTADLEHKIGVALGAFGHLREGIARMRRAGDAYWKAGDFDGFAQNASALGAQLYNTGETVAAIDLYRHAIDALASRVPAATVDLLRARAAYDCVAALDVESALAFAGEVSEPIDDPMTAAHVYQTRFKVDAMRGEIARWRIDAEAALDAARRVDDGGFRLRNTHAQIALDAVGLGEVEDARDHFRAATPPRRSQPAPGRELAAAASAFEHTLRGDFSTAGRLLEDVQDVPEQRYAVRVHVKTAAFALGICAGDDTLFRRDDTETFLHFGATRGMKLAIGLLGGPYAWALGLRGEGTAAAAWIHRISLVVPGPHRFMFAYLAAAQFGEKRDVAAMRPSLAEAASRPQDRVNKAALGLFDAFVAQRGGTGDGVRAHTLAAAALFEEIGWPWFAARGYELGGEAKRALDVYRTLGALRDVRRLEAERGTGLDAALSMRELEVAALVAKGHSNEEVSQLLHISVRTVEKHVSSALKKLDLRSRVQLGRLLARPNE